VMPADNGGDPFAVGAATDHHGVAARLRRHRVS
jgi:hypothetical protein